jgi:hypothetical protein
MPPQSLLFSVLRASHRLVLTKEGSGLRARAFFLLTHLGLTNMNHDQWAMACPSDEPVKVSG